MDRFLNKDFPVLVGSNVVPLLLVREVLEETKISNIAC